MLDRRLVLVTLVLAGCSSSSDDGPTVTPLTPAQKTVAEELTSIWENDTPVLDYAYSEDIGDGRGYTSGRAGFCTGTGDAIQVIACYDDRRTEADGNLMAKYMPALQTINDRFESTGEDQASTAELDAIGDWPTDWATSANDPATAADFKACQDQLVDELYYQPALEAAATWGLTSALSRAAFYDMWINQGDDSLVLSTNAALGVPDGTSPAVGYNGITEDAWLTEFLIERRDLMWADDTWKDAVDRVAGYEKQRRHANWDLSQAIRNDVRASDCWGGPYTSSGYTIREIQPDGTWTTPTGTAYSCD